MTFKLIFYITFHLICFTRFSLIIKGKLIVQATSKDLILLLQLSSAHNKCMRDPHVRVMLLLPPPPPPPPGLCVPTSGALRDGKGRGCCWSPPDSYALARISHGSDPSRYGIASVITDRSPITIGEHPCKRAGAGDIVLGSNRGGGV